MHIKDAKQVKDITFMFECENGCPKFEAPPSIDVCPTCGEDELVHPRNHNDKILDEMEKLRREFIKELALLQRKIDWMEEYADTGFFKKKF